MIKYLLPGIACILFIVSCQNKKSDQSYSRARMTGKLNFGVLRYDSSALEYRLDSIHNRGLVLQFCTKQAGDNNTAFQLISYAFDTLKDYNNSWMPDTLAIIHDSLPKNFDLNVAFGNNEATREIIVNTVRDENGKRFSYDYVEFTPVVEGVFKHVVYRLKTIKNGKPTEKGMHQMTSPMPPVRNWN
jgi:hypothetical protein